MLADSTIAMSAYNLVAIYAQPMELDLLLSQVHAAHGIDQRRLEHALEQLRDRGWVTIDEKRGCIDVRDLKRRVVKARDRRDMSGWSGWLVQCRQRGLITIDDAIAEGK